MRRFACILVTGGAGFIGSNFIRYLFGMPDFQGKVVNLDALTYAGNLENLADIDARYGGSRYFFARADICDRFAVEAVFGEHAPDAVAHFAAESHVDRSIAGPEAFIRTNVLGTFVLLDAASRAWAGREGKLFHHVSTDEVYGSLGAEGKFSEETRYDPRSPYSASKAGSDHLVMAYHHTYGLPITLSNCSNNYGPYHFPEKLLPLMILNMIEGKPLPVYGDGRNVRDWLFVNDHAAAIWTVMGAGRAGGKVQYRRQKRMGEHPVGPHPVRGGSSAHGKRLRGLRKAHYLCEGQAWSRSALRHSIARRSSVSSGGGPKQGSKRVSTVRSNGISSTVNGSITSAQARTPPGFRRITERDRVPILDTCIITASNERQASVFRTLLRRRVDGGLYPREIDFRVFSDPPAGRAGSGGGTIWALLSLLREEGLDLPARSDPSLARQAADHLQRRRILVIHAGGESRRLPAYVPEGKIFAPVPVPSSSFLPPVVLDVELSLFLKYPWREGELLVTSGDALVDFNTDLLNLPDAPLCGFAAPASFEQGSRHGVFAFDPPGGAVRDYLQKATPEFLSREARLEGTESCALDLGLVSFRGQALGALLATAVMPLSDGSITQRVGQGRLTLDLYLELLTACLGNLDRHSYGERLVGRSPAPADVLDLLFETFHPCGLAGALTKQTSFIHFGSAAEFPSSCRELRAREIAPFYALAHEELIPEVGPSLVRYNCDDAQVQAEYGAACAEDCPGRPGFVRRRQPPRRAAESHTRCAASPRLLHR